MSDSHVTIQQTRYAQMPEAVLYDRRLSDKAVRVYGSLLRHGADPDNCYPSHARIARFIGCSDRSIARPLADLVEAGWVEKRERFDATGARTSDGYWVRTIAQESATTTQESVDPPRAGAWTPHAQERDEGEPVEREQVKEKDSCGAELTLVTHDPRPDPLAAVFAAWKEATGRTDRVVLDLPRSKAIEKALKSYPLDDVLDAVRGLACSSWHMGDNPDGKRYDDLTLALRDSSQIEKFRDLLRDPPKVKKPAHKNLIEDRSFTGRVAL